jgi:glutathione synthase/RimK-type ligase-like ATP-grasp enzyme
MSRLFSRQSSPLFELAPVLVRLDQIAHFIVNPNHSIVRAAEKLRKADRLADCVWPSVSQ